MTALYPRAITSAEQDDRCWHELPFDELAAEAQAIADRTGDSVLGWLTSGLRATPDAYRAELVIARIEEAHASA